MTNLEDSWLGNPKSRRHFSGIMNNSFSRVQVDRVFRHVGWGWAARGVIEPSNFHGYVVNRGPLHTRISTPQLRNISPWKTDMTNGKSIKSPWFNGEYIFNLLFFYAFSSVMWVFGGVLPVFVALWSGLGLATMVSLFLGLIQPLLNWRGVPDKGRLTSHHNLLDWIGCDSWSFCFGICLFLWSKTSQEVQNWVVVSNTVYVHPYLGKIPSFD